MNAQIVRGLLLESRQERGETPSPRSAHVSANS